jgi:hypothetical protein
MVKFANRLQKTFKQLDITSHLKKEPNKSSILIVNSSLIFDNKHLKISKIAENTIQNKNESNDSDSDIIFLEFVDPKVKPTPENKLSSNTK